MRVFPHRDRPQDSDSRPRRRGPRARPILERLECRVLLSGTDPQVDAAPPLLPVLASWYDDAPGTSAPPTVSPIVLTGVDPPTAWSSPTVGLRTADLTPGPWHWVIDDIQIHDSATASNVASPSRIVLAESASPHSTMETAQPLPRATDIQIQGTSTVGEPADMYRMPVDSKSGSFILSLVETGSGYRGDRHLQIVDEDGNPYDVMLPSPSETLTIYLHERFPMADRALYLGVFTTPNTTVTTSDTTTVGDAYSLSVSQQPIAGTSDGTGQAGQTTETINYATASISPFSPSISWDFVPAPGTTRTESPSEQSETLQLDQVTTQGATLSLPTQIVSPEAGILSIGDETTAFIPSALAIDLALFDLDIPDESNGWLPAGDMDRWSANLSRPSGGLPLATLTRPDSLSGDRLAAATEDASPSRPCHDATPTRVEAVPATPPSDPKRWNLLHAGVGIASALAFACLMPDATLMFQKPKERRRPGVLGLPDLDEAEPADDCGR